jgi:hypothetical protein
MKPCLVQSLLLVLGVFAFLAGGCGKGSGKAGNQGAASQGGTSERPVAQVVPTAAGADSQDAAADAGNEQPALAGPPVVVSAEQFTKDYAADKEAADKKYKDKLLEVQSVVEEPCLKNVDGSPRPALAGFDPTHFIECRYQAGARRKVAHLTKGQKVKVRGRCYGLALAGPMLTGCEVLELGPDPAIPVTAERLTEDYGKDGEAAAKKYEGKQLVVEGVVTGTDPRRGLRLVILAGFQEKADTPLRVQASFHYDHEKSLEGLKEGQKVKVKGECLGVLDLGSGPGVNLGQVMLAE